MHSQGNSVNRLASAPQVIVTVSVVEPQIRVRERRCVRGAASVSETPSVEEPPATDETPSMDDPPCASGVVTSVPACVLPGTPCVKGAPQAEETAGASKTARCVNETPWVRAPAGVCVYEAPGVSERPSVVRVTACVRSLYTREMTVAMHDHAAASPRVSANGIVCSLGLVTRRCVRRAWRLRLQLWRYKCRVAAVVAFGTVPGLHGRARVVRTVPRTRPPRARLRE